MTAYLRTGFELGPIRRFIATVHRLSNLGAVVTRGANTTSQDGFEAEWPAIDVLTIDGDLISRCEIFDEDDLDAALAAFDELNLPTPKLENAASQIDERFRACFAARDWDGMAQTVTAEICTDDRRPVVGTGIRTGRDAAIAHAGATADVGVKNITSTPIATRGQRLILRRTRYSGRDQQPEAFHTETLGIVEINADYQITAAVQFDPEDMDAAIAELDARYVAGEAAAHAHTWSVIARTYAVLNRGEVPDTTPHWVNLDHRAVTPMPDSELTANLRTSWVVAPEPSVYIESVHRLTDLGVVVTHVARGASQDGFDAERRSACLLTVEGDLISRGELFDESDLDVAVARFDELSQPAQEK